jgi:hypothetical protein
MALLGKPDGEESTFFETRYLGTLNGGKTWKEK